MTHWQGMRLYQQFEQLPQFTDHPEDLHDLMTETLWSDDLSGGFQLGGCATPIQQDHRFFFEDFQSFDRCVLNFGELPGLELPDMNLAVLIREHDLKNTDFSNVVLIADTD